MLAVKPSIVRGVLAADDDVTLGLLDEGQEGRALRRPRQDAKENGRIDVGRVKEPLLGVGGVDAADDDQ